MTIPSTVTSIGKYAFNECDKLTNIVIPSSVTLIDSNAFGHCGSLKEIIIPSSVKSIGENAFSFCYSLKEIIIPSSVISIGDCIVSASTKLSKIIIPSDVKNIGKLNFHYFAYLTEFIIPSSVTIINESAFYSCSSLIKVEIPSSVTDIENSAFKGCTALKEIIIPPSVISIGLEAFCECGSLNDIIIPSTIKSIGFNAFKKCSSLKKITFNPQINNQNLNNIKILTKITDIKILVLGCTYIGKTSLLLRYTKNTFQENTKQTIGLEYFTKNIDIDEFKIKLHIHSILFTDLYLKLVKMFCNGSECAIVVFDLTNQYAFERLKDIFDTINENMDNSPTVLLGNKCDLNHKIDDENIKEVEKKYNTKYFEISAKNNINVDTSFEYIVSETVKNILKEKERLQILISGKQRKCNIY